MDRDAIDAAIDDGGADRFEFAAAAIEPVAGWGDYEIASEITPGITTIQPHSYEMGQRAMTLIVERASGIDRRGVSHDTGFQVVRRESV
ncbi:hypothetical protein [Rhizobium sp. Rhizsp42]|uniref:hypothetical protein n=1 Tax=Rhizobium sp. Rhizsp42 TaxID=3243034 RepID=UPI0039AED30C